MGSLGAGPILVKGTVEHDCAVFQKPVPSVHVVGKVGPQPTPDLHEEPMHAVFVTQNSVFSLKARAPVTEASGYVPLLSELPTSVV